MLEGFLTKYDIAQTDRLIVACSGGADSMLLLFLLLQAHPNEHIVVGHFNHRLRGDESDTDELFVRDFCEDRNILFEVGSSSIVADARTAKTGIEETARNKRYEFLESLRQKQGARFVLTAHHLDDSIETLMFNLIRWTRLGGLSGIPEQNVNILRPFLSLSKKEILHTLGEHEIPYRTDSSNVDVEYSRNRIRANALPELEKINAEYRKNLRSFMLYAGELQVFIDGEIMNFIGDKNFFPAAEFSKLSFFLQRETVRFLYSRANNGTMGLSEWNITETIRFILEASGGTEKSIQWLKLTKKSGKISF